MLTHHHRTLFSVTLALTCLGLAQHVAADPPVTFQRIQLTDVFYSEGAGIGDINQDGHGDAIYGPHWYAGPDFKKQHEIYPVEKFDPLGYSNNFITFVSDVNGDKYPDVLVNAWPGKDVSWFENPGGKSAKHWKRHLAHPEVDNESPGFGDINGDKVPEIVFHTKGVLGFASPGDSSAERWPFLGCSERNEKWQRYTHGLGYGDVNGDGRVDLLMANGWWEQPATINAAKPWKMHAFPFCAGGAQMHTYDVDGDGDHDVITSLVAHGYGLAWFEHVKKDGEISFVQHNILSPKADEKTEGVQFSQLHSVELADINGDGLDDIITGKRYWAHGPKNDADPNGAAVLYWFELRRDSNGASYHPHEIDNDSGVGTQFAVGDLNGDQRIDIVTGNKKGAHVFLQTSPKSAGDSKK